MAMDYTMNSHDFYTVVRRIQRNDRVLTHLLVCETPTDVKREVPHFEMTYVKGGGLGLEILCDTIGQNTHLQDLCFDAQMGLIHARTSHFDGLRRNESVRSLGLSRCNLNQGVGREVLRAFEENHERLTKLALWRCRMRREGPDALASTLARCTRLTEVSLSSCGVDDAIVEKLAEALKGRRELETLDLQENRIRGAGCQSLATLLRDPECGLVKLDLHNNTIDDCGAKAVAGALADNTKLEILCLDQNCITDDGWNAFVHVLCNKSSINATFESNHTLHTIESSARADVPGRRTTDDDGAIPPRRLIELTSLNGRARGDDPGRRRARAARRKVLDAHFRDAFDAAPFAEGRTDVRLLPRVLSWMGTSCGAQRPHCLVGHTAVYELLRQMPTLCEDEKNVLQEIEEAGAASADPRQARPSIVTIDATRGLWRGIGKTERTLDAKGREREDELAQ